MAFFEFEGLVAALLFFFWLWALIDSISTDSSLCRNLPKGVWIILVLLLFDIGALLWLLLGRPERAHWRPGTTDYASPHRPVGMEDHPRYSAIADVTDRRSEELDRRLAQWEAEQRKKGLPAPASSDPDLDAQEAELRRREADVRRRELELRERELERLERERLERDATDD
ncbi:MAG: hypothetical protein JWL83_1734 [Actinomycetia bacterium]|nr:hypothetical protein [Actinomycetes bacterium]